MGALTAGLDAIAIDRVRGRNIHFYSDMIGVDDDVHIE